MRRALLAFVVSRVLLVLAIVLFSPLEDHWWPQDAPQPYTGSVEHGVVGWQTGGTNGRFLYHPEPLIDAWFRHDSNFYLEIAVFGYGPAEAGIKSREGFFPGYPMLMQAVRPVAEPLARGLRTEELGDLTPWPLVAGMLVSNLAALGALVLLVRLATRFLGQSAGTRAGVIFAVSPLSFLLGAGLTEAVFLLAAIGSLAALERKKILLAALLAALATFIRITGLALLLPLAAVLWSARKTFAPVDFLALLVVPAGLLVALLTIGRGAGDPLIYFGVQQGFGHEGFPTLQGITDLFRLRTFLPFEAWRNFVQVTALLVSLALLGWQIRLSVSRTLPWHWLLFSVPMLALPALAGNVISLPRYAMTIVPLYLVAAAVVPGGRAGWVLAGLSLVAQAALFLGFEAHLPVVI